MEFLLCAFLKCKMSEAILGEKEQTKKLYRSSCHPRDFLMTSSSGKGKRGRKEKIRVEGSQLESIDRNLLDSSITVPTAPCPHPAPSAPPPPTSNPLPRPTPPPPSTTPRPPLTVCLLGVSLPSLPVDTTPRSPLPSLNVQCPDSLTSVNVQCITCPTSPTTRHSSRTVSKS